MKYVWLRILRIQAEQTYLGKSKNIADLFSLVCGRTHENSFQTLPNSHSYLKSTLKLDFNNSKTYWFLNFITVNLILYLKTIMKMVKYHKYFCPFCILRRFLKCGTIVLKKNPHIFPLLYPFIQKQLICSEYSKTHLELTNYW